MDFLDLRSLICLGLLSLISDFLWPYISDLRSCSTLPINEYGRYLYEWCMIPTRARLTCRCFLYGTATYGRYTGVCQCTYSTKSTLACLGSVQLNGWYGVCLINMLKYYIKMLRPLAEWPARGRGFDT